MLAQRHGAGADTDDKKYVILISSNIITKGVPDATMYLGRPWTNSELAWPQAVVRNCDIGSGITDAHPWTDMLPDEPWQAFGRSRSTRTSVPEPAAARTHRS